MTENRENESVTRHGAASVRKATACVVGIVLIGGVVAVGRVLYGQPANQPPTEVGPPERAGVPVVVTPAATRQFERSILVQGNVEAKSYAMVSPRIGGTTEAIFVDEGDRVVAGGTKLFAVDQVNLEKAVQIAEHALDVARSSTREKEAGLERVEVDLHKASLDYERFERLRDKEVVTADAFEQQQSRYLQLQAMLKHARTLVELSKAQERQAEASLEVARKNLADAIVYAPINGTISERLHEPGEMANPGDPILRIDDPSVVEIAAFLPSQHYPEVIVDETVMHVRVGSTELRDLVACYRSPTINPKLRTFEVKCRLENPPAGVVPGAMANITIVFETRAGLGVPSMALQNRGGRSVVFVIRDGVAQQEPVTTGIEAGGWTEIRTGNVQANEPVVTLGQNMLNPGAAVQVQQEEK